MSSDPGATPLRVAVVNDHELVVRGVAGMLAPFDQRVVVVELDCNAEIDADVDVALYDSFSMPHLSSGDLGRVVGNPRVGRTVLYTWSLTPELAQDARDRGVAAALSKGMEAHDLVAALERVHGGEGEVAPFPEQEQRAGAWPGQAEGLTARESEIVALVTAGLSNNDIAGQAYLSINSVKSYIRSAYRTMGVTSRSQAVLWGIDHGFAKDRVRITPVA